MSTSKMALGFDAGARFPRASIAVPDAIEIPSVPSPVMPERVTVLVAPLPVTAMLAFAVPVLLRVISPADSELDWNVASV